MKSLRSVCTCCFVYQVIWKTVFTFVLIISSCYLCKSLPVFVFLIQIRNLIISAIGDIFLALTFSRARVSVRPFLDLSTWFQTAGIFTNTDIVTSKTSKNFGNCKEKTEKWFMLSTVLKHISHEVTVFSIGYLYVNFFFISFFFWITILW